MPELVSKWKDARGTVHDTFAECVIGEIACLIGKIGSGDASFAPAIARKIVENAEDVIHQLEILKERLDEHPAEKEQLRKALGLPDPATPSDIPLPDAAFRVSNGIRFLGSRNDETFTDARDIPAAERTEAA